MNLTQVAGSQIGVLDLYDDTGRAKPSSPIVLIVDPQTHNILDYITTKNIIRDNHKKSLEDTLETFNFTTFADKRFSQHLEKRNRIIIPDEDNNLVEFVPFEIVKYRDSEGHKIQVYSHASYLEIKKANVIYPNVYEGTATQHLGRALNNTGWRLGTVESGASRSITFDNHTNPFAYIKRIARELELEPNFRIEHDGAKITGRYVDLLERVGAWRNRTVEFGKDLQGIRRVEKQDIYTALLGVMPEDEEGNQQTVLVEDEEALQRWGRIDEHGELQHLIGTHVIQSTRTEMTEEEARQYTRTELDKRINATVTYEANIVDLEHVPGMRNKKIRHGDTIRIKDTKFNPPLYLEARVFESEGSIKERGNKKVKLGDFVEFTEDEVNAIWNQLKNQIRNRITAAELADYTYKKIEIDDKDESVRSDVESYANTVSSEAKDEAITYTNNTVDPIVVTVDDIEVDLDDVKSDVSDTISQISQLSDRVSVVVAENGTINAEAIASELSVTPSAIDLISDNITLSANQINFDGHVFGSDATFRGYIEANEMVDDRLHNAYFNGGEFRFVKFKSGISDPDTETIDLSEVEHATRIFHDGVGFANEHAAAGFGLHGITHSGMLNFYVESMAVDAPNGMTFMYDADVWGDFRVDGSLTLGSAQSGGGRNNDLRFGTGKSRHSIGDYSGSFTFYGNRANGYPFRVRSGNNGSSFRDDFWIASDGTIYSNPTYDTTSSNSANVRIGSGTNARFLRTTSARKYKTDIKPIDVDYRKILDMSLSSWLDIGDVQRNGGSYDGVQRHYGIIANELAEVGLPQYVDYHNDEVEHYHERAWTLLIPNVRDNRDNIEKLKTENELLKNEIKILKERIA